MVSSSFAMIHDDGYLHSDFFRVDNLSKRGSVREGWNVIPEITNA